MLALIKINTLFDCLLLLFFLFLVSISIVLFFSITVLFRKCFRFAIIIGTCSREFLFYMRCAAFISRSWAKEWERNAPSNWRNCFSSTYCERLVGRSMCSNQMRLWDYINPSVCWIQFNYILWFWLLTKMGHPNLIYLPFFGENFNFFNFYHFFTAIKSKSFFNGLLLGIYGKFELSPDRKKNCW